MKLLVPAILVVCLLACHNQKVVPELSMCVYVVGDETDHHRLVPEADPVLRLYGLDQHPTREAWFWFTAIKNVRQAPVVSEHLGRADEAGVFGDPQQRNRSIVRFYEKVRHVISSYKVEVAAHRELGNSECFYTVADALWCLSKSTAGRKVLLVYSNLFEKSFVDLYAKHFSPAQIVAAFRKENALPKLLHRIQVVFIFDPQENREADRRYNYVFEAYKTLLEAGGATVVKQAQNQTFDIP